MATTKKAAPAKAASAKKAATEKVASAKKAATEKVAEEKPSNDKVAAKLSELKKKVESSNEWAWYNIHVLPLQHRYDAGEVSESLTETVMQMKHPA